MFLLVKYIYGLICVLGVAALGIGACLSFYVNLGDMQIDYMWKIFYTLLSITGMTYTLQYMARL